MCEKYGSHRNHRKKFLEDIGFSADPKNKDDESIYRQFIGNKTDMISISKDKLLIICARIVDNKYDAFYLFFCAGYFIFPDRYTSYLDVLNDFYDLDIGLKNPEERYECLSELLKNKHYKGISEYL